MIVSLISSALGMVGGLLPEIFKEVRESREHGRELERMDKQAAMQIRLLQHQTDAKLAEVEGNLYVEEIRAFRAQMGQIYKSQAPVGVKWVDGWNACMRPFACTLIILLFAWIAVTYSWGMYAGKPQLVTVAAAIWGSLVGDAIQAVLGYLFGYRSSAKIRELARR